MRRPFARAKGQQLERAAAAVDDLSRRSVITSRSLTTARRCRTGLLVTTNQLVLQWGQVFGDDVLAAAILDRPLHHSHALLIQGDSYRLKTKRKAGILSAQAVQQR